MKTIEISTVQEYLQYVDQVQEDYPTYQIDDYPVIGPNFLFRGISRKEYGLLPGILRMETIHGRSDIAMELPKYTMWAQERAIIEHFQTEACFYLKGVDLNDWVTWTEYAQHYGVPTRFLDWSSNSLVALYFACKDNVESDAAVWFLHLSNYQRLKTKTLLKEMKPRQCTLRQVVNRLLSGELELVNPIIYKPYYVDAHMNAQSSYFMVWGDCPDPLEQQIPLENHMTPLLKPRNWLGIAPRQRNGLLCKCHIHACQKQLLLRQLDALGINEKTLFPGLDGIGRYVEWKYRTNSKDFIAYYRRFVYDGKTMKRLESKGE